MRARLRRSDRLARRAAEHGYKHVISDAGVGVARRGRGAAQRGTQRVHQRPALKDRRFAERARSRKSSASQDASAAESEATYALVRTKLGS
jgi:hypothetical protein